jgi:AraC-like DNA-binding protein
VIKIEYNLTSYDELLKHLARTLELKITGDSVVFTHGIAKGSVRLIKLPNGLEMLLYDYTPLQDMLFHGKKTTKEFFTFRFDEISGGTEAAKSSVFFGNTTHEWYHLAAANVPQKNINIILSRDWLQKMLSRESHGDTILNFISLKTPTYHYELLDIEYRRLISEMTDVAINKDLECFIVQNRVMVMIERFFTRLYKKISEGSASIKISAEEIVRLKLVEQALLADFSNLPPNINQLSRIAAMSPSKLKDLFKKMFGLPVYQYYQKNRMNKAKAMLLSKKYSVQRVSAELGYNNVNDFSKTFVKTFDQLPDEI